ncbi:MAG: CAF17-like 4Fe-4S cluster assembly/insertion protein YgfZ [Dyella sp.]|uniref:CAF17-like 4Fe-4S cluster assembly/insertion protein YgfZ n=1 Tax=Dyella sp. TaxID=1869338 RepID=UPI003F817664
MPDPSCTTAETLLIEGPDAVAFAQSQFTVAVASIAPGEWQFGAWLDAQGRVRYLFHLARLAPERLLLLLRGGHADAIKNELSRFVFRAKLSMHADNSRSLATADALPLHQVHALDNVTRFGCDDHSLVLSSDANGDTRWHSLQIAAGWPWLPDTLLGTCLPPALSLHRLHAVSLDKGCYPGQEIVARLHYRGGNKRHLCRVGLSQPVASGTLLEINGDGPSIQLLNATSTDRGTEAIALCHSELARAEGPVTATHAGQKVSVERLETWPA